MTGKQLASEMKRRDLTVGEMAKRSGYTVNNVRNLLARYELPSHAARLFELVFAQVDAERSECPAT